jgi:urease accessory protein
MRRAIEAVPQGAWPRGRRVGSVTLGWDDRHRRRLRLIRDDGAEFLLDLPAARVLREGDGLILDDGGVVEVRAAEEAVADVAAESPAALARLAWHLGNRHTDVQVIGERLRIRRDHVLEEMLVRLGARLTPMDAPFEPERGAYETHAHGRAHGHDHG